MSVYASVLILEFLSCLCFAYVQFVEINMFKPNRIIKITRVSPRVSVRRACDECVIMFDIR